MLSKLLDVVLKGGGGTLPELKPFMTRLSELSVQAGCLLCGHSVIIPPNL